MACFSPLSNANCLDVTWQLPIKHITFYFPDEIEEELAPLTEALEPPPLETYADQLDKARQATQGLSWVHILGENKFVETHLEYSVMYFLEEMKQKKRKEKKKKL